MPQVGRQPSQAPKMHFSVHWESILGLVANECSLAFFVGWFRPCPLRPFPLVGRAGLAPEGQGGAPRRRGREGSRGCSRRREENVCADLPSLGPATLRACAWLREGCDAGCELWSGRQREQIIGKGKKGGVIRTPSRNQLALEVCHSINVERSRGVKVWCQW